jgi:hypothetical protein
LVAASLMSQTREKEIFQMFDVDALRTTTEELQRDTASLEATLVAFRKRDDALFGFYGPIGASFANRDASDSNMVIAQVIADWVDSHPGQTAAKNDISALCALVEKVHHDAMGDLSFDTGSGERKAKVLSSFADFASAGLITDVPEDVTSGAAEAVTAWTDQVAELESARAAEALRKANTANGHGNQRRSGGPRRGANNPAMGYNMYYQCPQCHFEYREGSNLGSMQHNAMTHMYTAHNVPRPYEGSPEHTQFTEAMHKVANDPTCQTTAVTPSGWRLRKEIPAALRAAQQGQVSEQVAAPEAPAA